MGIARSNLGHGFQSIIYNLLTILQKVRATVESRWWRHWNAKYKPYIQTQRPQKFSHRVPQIAISTGCFPTQPALNTSRTGSSGCSLSDRFANHFKEWNAEGHVKALVMIKVWKRWKLKKFNTMCFSLKFQTCFRIINRPKFTDRP